VQDAECCSVSPTNPKVLSLKTTPLREARQAKGMTLVELAAAAKTDTGHLSRVERDESSISPSLAETIAEIIGRDLIHEMQILYPSRYRTTTTKKASEVKPVPLRLKVGGFLYALLGPAA
jgi:transcriptional regulator with XRE-family HTH domain